MSFKSTFDLVFSYFTEFDEENPPDGMMCTNVSMWSDVYWTPENVSACACEIETKKEEKIEKVLEYCKIASSNTSRLEAHVGFFRLLMKEIFGPYVL